MNLAVINPFDLAGSIEKTFQKWLTDVIESFFKFIADGLFSGTELSGIFKQMNTIFIAIGSSVIICIVLYRIIVGMLSEGEGKTQDQLLSELAIGGVKVGMMIYLLPILLSFCLNKIIYPFCKYLFVDIADSSAKTFTNFAKFGLKSMGFASLSGIMLVLMLLFMTVVVISFVYRFCVFHAEWIYIQVFSVWVAISYLTVDNNMINDYLKRVGYEFTNLIIAVSAMAGIIELLAKKNIGAGDVMLIIGLGFVEIKGAGIANVIFGGRPSGGLMRGISSTVSNATRMFKK
ncbi:hypothetical protein CKN63_12945 [Carnobacterium divergens]|uniref:hypothetical protein n=1 Tax=Bacteria TaxID=2 RepID=UPI000BA5A2B2|nr:MULTISPECIES: hypothetical protein [Lactobacillales]EGO9051921.1 hypothetical protein [Enterococcus faecalis]MBS4464918.1 hypothetical protein [Lactococcus garvieae]MCO0817234.1 hypothetical protein [Lactococcus lactis]MCT0076507.1 hypothetical protein [Lactococcus lactis subsp. lactis]MCT0474474.1 hypothetical protein [Lactococcus cremoris]